MQPKQREELVHNPATASAHFEIGGSRKAENYVLVAPKFEIVVCTTVSNILENSNFNLGGKRLRDSLSWSQVNTKCQEQYTEQHVL